MATKKEKRLAAAAAARKLLGMEDGDASSNDDGVPQRAESLPGDAGTGPARPVHGNKSKRAPVPSGDDQAPTSSERPRPTQQSANDHARATGLAQVTDAAGTVDKKHWPKKHPPGSLKRGDSVWYRGERFWVEFCPTDWSNGCYARICEKQVHPDKNIRSGSDLAYVNEKGEGHGAPFVSICVHADLLETAPPVRMYHAASTLSQEERKARAKQGVHDVGDEVATLLRGAKSLDEMYAVGADYLSTTVDDLKKRYGHLNPGQQRMNVGNKMRALWRKNNK